MPFYLLDREPLATGLRRIAHEQIAIALRDLGDDDLPLHQRLHSLRSRTKKMRGLLRLPGPLMGAAFEIEDRRVHAAADAVDWTDAVAAARAVASAAGIDLVVAPDAHDPWHPGRCAALTLADGTLVGHAGELHPKVLETLVLP